MNKLEVQQRVLQNGKPLDLDKFEWDEKTRTFSSAEDRLVLDFCGVDSVVFTTGSSCTFTTGLDCTFTTDSDCTFKTGSECTFTTGSDCTFTTGSDCTFTTGSECTFKTGSNCTFKTDSDCTFKTGSDCTFKTGSDCTFTTGSDCTFKTGSNCTFKTGLDCTFTTGSECTFTTGLDCTFTTDSGCIFTTGSDCVIVRRDIFEVIQPKENEVIQLCPYNIKGHLVNGKLNGVPHIIADHILSKVVSQKGGVFRVINHGETEQSYLIKRGDKYAHGRTLKEAKDSLIYKLSTRDTSKFKDLTLDSVLTKNEMIECYMTITGACSAGTRYFVEQQENVKKEYSIKEVIELTKGQYNNELFKSFFNNLTKNKEL